MRATRVVLAIIAASVALGTAAAQTCMAQTWPARPVTMVVPFAAGGGTDVLGRIVGRRLTETLGQQVVIENVGGAGGMMGSARVVKSPPDGYTFVLGSRADAINQTLYKNPLYNLQTDLAPVVLIADQPMVLVTRKDLPVADLPEFIAYVKKNQATMQFGSAGAGSTGHVDCALLNAALNVNVTHVPYRGGGPAMQDLIAGRLDYFCTLSGTIVPQIQSNLVKAIAVFTRDRLPTVPDLKSAYEQGFTELEASTWFGFFVPAGTPEAVIQRLHAATSEAIDTPAVQLRLLEVGALVVARDRRSPTYFKRYVETEIAKNAAPLKAAGISMD
jgi:tripartite-type tricarboxylate transporter receptor subunit TctC